ncbi:peroxide stress protein YaaA [Roseovarius atlanticus]|uniref:peroxide stress protein YaaA n=1 Tax=Roseovarius atlanticus TaxID=1641875 RepID=UPI001C97EC9A|nr:peroxide stress protein YaaA [Roseovarius atlanticus]MBY5987385.1 peroxide stress protein YaaA [Roseovarius atlanticus]MBY6126025.1 peroxide stress protein YaaA [Roseovarius atlanticus]MBY6149515.1 peroxide stress protein YaaA [Roseovarius atlanticus]
MLVVVSPAKKMDMSPAEGIHPTGPAFAKDAHALADVARDLSQADLKKLMGISDDLAKLNADRFRDFGKQEKKPAALAFAGDTYQGLEAGSLDTDELDWAQDHLRILSGLYGLLRPLDNIEPYRLEMGSRLKTEKGKSLYDYWGDRLSKALNRQAKETGSKTLVNCASQEYFGAVDRDALKLRVITPTFLDTKNGEAKVISFFAKKARGAMARFIVQNRLTDPDSLKDFDSGGYRYDADRSTEDEPAFIRGEQ